MRYPPSADAPTHLGSHQLGLPPEWLPGDVDEIDPPTSDARPRSAAAPSRLLQPATPPKQRTATKHPAYHSTVEPVAPPPRVVTEHSGVYPAVAPRVPTERGSRPSQSASSSKKRAKSAPSHPPYHEARVADASVIAPRPATSAPRAPSQPAAPSSPELAAQAAAIQAAQLAAQLAAQGAPPEQIQAAQAAAIQAAQIAAQLAKQPAPSPAPTPTPQAPAQRPTPQPGAQQLAAGINAIDPLDVQIPPELGAPIYGWIRRLALQADLAGADRVLRDALLDLTSSLSVSIVYPGEDGLWSLGSDEEIPRDAQPLIAVATARRAVISSHTALIPVITSSETVAVITLTRNPRNPGYHPVEQIAMIALARESAAILHHLAVTHLQRAAEINADKGGLYRGEALEAHRSRGNEGVPVHLTPAWVRRTYPMLIIAILVAVVVSVFITVPTYSTGPGMVSFQGTAVTAPAPGTVDQVFVQQGDQVKKGQVLARLHAANEEAELAQANSELEAIKIQYLFDQTDEQVKKSLASATARVERARAQVDTRVIRARKDGTVSDRRIQPGQALNTGDHILTIVDPGTEPEIVAFLPGKDRPRLRKGMELQIELAGYKKTREIAIITSVGSEVIGGQEAARFLGAQQADSIKLQNGSFVIVKARLPSRTFKTEHRTYRYYHGMLATTESKIQSKPFLVSLLPALEKYIPD
ncbi:MAG TPA: HlyD family efflux transporter periplasmic adaptor subunit [Kofleriaceae bacterium]|nr:HlyD family efflux transporter periplasmic adaptor subunit [Kofleriaceae bacterium]